MSKMDDLRRMREANAEGRPSVATQIRQKRPAFDRTAYQRDYMRKKRAETAAQRKKTSRFVIYAVTLKEHPGVVKVGMTTNWDQRRTQYDNWNLSAGNAMEACSVFIITEAYVDLAVVEAMCLKAMPFKLRHGAEWFHGNLQEAAGTIAVTLANAGLTFIET